MQFVVRDEWKMNPHRGEVSRQLVEQPGKFENGSELAFQTWSDDNHVKYHGANSVIPVIFARYLCRIPETSSECGWE